MTTHAVVLIEPNADVEQRIIDNYPKPRHFKLTDAFYLVRDGHLSEDIAVSAGLKGDERIEQAAGVVFRLNRAYAGYASPLLWEWLVDAEES